MTTTKLNNRVQVSKEVRNFWVKGFKEVKAELENQSFNFDIFYNEFIRLAKGESISNETIEEYMDDVVGNGEIEPYFTSNNEYEDEIQLANFTFKDLKLYMQYC